MLKLVIAFLTLSQLWTETIAVPGKEIFYKRHPRRNSIEILILPTNTYTVKPV